MPSSFRSIDGTGNNEAHPSWGSAGTNLLRIAPASYSDNIDDPTVGQPARPSPRTISNALADEGEEREINNRLMSAMIYGWGQFLDHDIDLTTNASPAETFNIAVPAGDPYFDPHNTGTQVIPFRRSSYDPSTGTSAGNRRQQTNVITAWIDGSQIYGSDTVTADKLRTHIGGKLKTSPGELLPLNNSAYFPSGPLPMANDAHIIPDDQMFAAGDVRANENIELLSLHTLFVREHNRLADLIATANPTFDDTTIYQTARAWVIAELQAITYNEWLPALLGVGAMPAYQGYNANINPGIANEFSTAVFRVGHTMLGDDVEFLNNNGQEVAEEMPLFEAFFNPPALTATGVGPILKYLVSDPSSEVDSTVVNSVRNFLFGPPGAGGFDLASLNIQRGRDHGLADYNTVRQAYGLPRINNFNQITSDPQLRQRLRDMYGNVNNIDLWVGALAEDHVPGTSTGPLIQRALVDQFSRLRDGDSFWYQRVFSGAQLAELNNTKLTDIIARNTEINNLQNSAFFFRVAVNGRVFNDVNWNGVCDSGEHGLNNRTLELLNEDGEVIATTTTDNQGYFNYDVLDGLGLGEYVVRQVMPNGWQCTTQPALEVTLTRGEQFMGGADFGNAKPAPPIVFFPSTGSSASFIVPNIGPVSTMNEEASFSDFGVLP